MKKLSYEDWQKNPIPRMMWVWNEDEMYKVKRKVVYVLRDSCYAKVITVDDDDSDYELYNYCAEIEAPRRMTNKELAWWLREKPTREFKYNYCDDNCIHSYLYYYESSADKEVDESVVIREDDGEWREPLVEV